MRLTTVARKEWDKLDGTVRESFKKSLTERQKETDHEPSHLVYPKIALEDGVFQAIFIVRCGCDLYNLVQPCWFM